MSADIYRARGSRSSAIEVYMSMEHEVRAAPSSIRSPHPPPSPLSLSNQHALTDDAPQMALQRRSGTDAGAARAEHIARVLLRYADLPPLMRVHALLVLGTSMQQGYLNWARQAVEVLESFLDDLPPDEEPSLVVRSLDERTRWFLQIAEEDARAPGGRMRRVE